MTDAPTVSDRDVYITRAFDAPRDVVWGFWTKPELISQWFGPDTFHTPIETVEIDLEEGGRWNLSMVNEAGESFPITGRIVKLIENEYLEVVLGAESESGTLENIVLRVTFHDHGERTRVTLHQGPFTEEQRHDTAVGWEMSFVKLDIIFEEAGA